MRNDFESIISFVAELQGDLESLVLPPEEGNTPISFYVLPNAITKGTRGYIEKVSQQINGCYENGWYDACAVMMRKLLETLIIEVFEAKKIDHKIKNPAGDFLFLSDLISKTLGHKEFNLGRNVKKGLKEMKDLGDKSAHGRRFNAQRQYIDDIKTEFRDAIQELLSLANLR